MPSVGASLGKRVVSVEFFGKGYKLTIIMILKTK